MVLRIDAISISFTDGHLIYAVKHSFDSAVEGRVSCLLVGKDEENCDSTETLK